MKSAELTAVSDLSLPEDSYIYHIMPFIMHIAAICSDDSIRLINPETLQASHIDEFRKFRDGHTGVTSIDSPNGNPNMLFTSGRDAKVKGWDMRTGSQTTNFESNKSAPYLSLACDDAFIAAGTELENHQAVVSIWDYRNPSVPIRQYAESHNDDITELVFHPTNSKILLSGSTDSLINIYDTAVADEDEVLINITNHGSSIHQSRFLSEDSFFGLSHDESFSVYKFDPLNRLDDETTGSDHFAFGDIREVLDCDYVASVLPVFDGGSAYVCAGSHRRQYLDIVPLNHNSVGPQTFDKENSIRLQGAHGEEVVRSVLFIPDITLVFTAGEDGHVRAWRGTNEAKSMANNRINKGSKRDAEETEGLGEKSSGGKKSSARFKPY